MIEHFDHINPKVYFPNSLYIIEYAFSIGDKHYFKYHDPYNLPAERALTTIVFYREVELNVDRAYMQAHCEALINLLTPTKERPTIEVGEALALERQLLQRMQMPKDSELMFKLASLVFFDQTENPLTYEYKYGQEKIAHWKREASVKDFFLQKPLVELIPYLEHAGQNLEAYEQMVQDVKKKHSERLSHSLSSEQLTNWKSKNV